jgi:hypothetical protein
MPLKPPDFDRWFATAAAAGRPDTPYSGLSLDAGWLYLPSGRLMALEPLAVPDPDKWAFVQAVPAARYPVHVLNENDTDRVAAVRLVVRDEPAATWEMALPPGRDVGDLGEDGFYGFAVDGGLACYTDPRTMLALDSLEIPDSDGESWFEILSMDMGDSPVPLVTLTDPGQDEAPVVVGFRTGDGDGRYPTWAGRNSDGDITCFASDFLLRSFER